MRPFDELVCTGLFGASLAQFGKLSDYGCVRCVCEMRPFDELFCTGLFGASLAQFGKLSDYGRLWGQFVDGADLEFGLQAVGLGRSGFIAFGGFG